MLGAFTVCCSSKLHLLITLLPCIWWRLRTGCRCCRCVAVESTVGAERQRDKERRKDTTGPKEWLGEGTETVCWTDSADFHSETHNSDLARRRNQATGPQYWTEGRYIPPLCIRAVELCHKNSRFVGFLIKNTFKHQKSDLFYRSFIYIRAVICDVNITFFSSRRNCDVKT